MRELGPLPSENVNGEVIILSGPPAAGKTTIAELIASNADTATVHLVTDTFYRAIRAGHVPPYLRAAHRQNEVVMDAIAAAVTAYARGGYDVVVDGIIGPWFLAPFRQLMDEHQLPVSYIVLRPTLETALVRAQQRSGDELKDVDPIAELYVAFGDLGELESHVIDNHRGVPRDTATEVRSAVAKGTHRLT